MLLASRDVDCAAQRHTDAETAAAPYKTMVRDAEERLHAAERETITERVRQQLEQISWEQPTHTTTRSRDKSVGIELEL